MPNPVVVPIQEGYPTLDELYRSMPKSLGFDIEIKFVTLAPPREEWSRKVTADDSMVHRYPTEMNVDMFDLHWYSRNEIVDLTLKACIVETDGRERVAWPAYLTDARHATPIEDNRWYSTTRTMSEQCSSRRSILRSARCCMRSVRSTAKRARDALVPSA